MAVQDASLSAQRFDYARVAVPHVRDVVVGIQVALAVNVVNPHSLASNELQRLLVEEGGVAPQNVESALEKGLRTHFFEL
jgi:hypothetical protein